MSTTNLEIQERIDGDPLAETTRELEEMVLPPSEAHPKGTIDGDKATRYWMARYRPNLIQAQGKTPQQSAFEEFYKECKPGVHPDRQADVEQEFALQKAEKGFVGIDETVLGLQNNTLMEGYTFLNSLEHRTPQQEQALHYARALGIAKQAGLDGVVLTGETFIRSAAKFKNVIGVSPKLGMEIATKVFEISGAPQRVERRMRENPSLQGVEFQSE